MIWCVEDDASIRDIEVYALQSTGYEAKGFEDGTSFLKELKNQKPELVVLDVMLPGIDGITRKPEKFRLLWQRQRERNMIRFRDLTWVRIIILRNRSV